MNPMLRAVLVFFGFLFAYAAIIGAIVGLTSVGITFAFVLVLYVLFWFGWLMYTFLRYRLARQSELRQILVTAMESNTPLPLALRSYVAERPDDTMRQVWLAGMLNLVCPGYYWFWHRQRSFDRRVKTLADSLEAGVSLREALDEIPALADTETRVAVLMGEVTGDMLTSLKRADQERESASWVELLPVLAYPLILCHYVIFVMGFLSILVYPKLNRILDEMGTARSDNYQRAGLIFEFIAEYAWVAVVLFPVGVFAVACFIAMPTVRWHLPIIGRLYRWSMQGRILRALGTFTASGRPISEALEHLEVSRSFAPIVRRRISGALNAVERGEPWTTSLARYGLLPRGMVPLVESSERAQTLPWTLPEIGNYLSQRGLRFIQRLVYIVSPVTIVLIGLLVGVVVVGTFVPLIDIMEQLQQ